MTMVVIPPTEESVYEDETTSPLDRTFRLDAQSQLGFGLIRPFRRDEKSDFANSGGVALVKACVTQVLMTRGANPDNPEIQGEIPWAPERGALLQMLRHQKNNVVLQELGRIYVIDALRRWEPRIVVRGTKISREKTAEGAETILLIRIVYDVLATNQNSNQVLYEGVDQTLSLPT